MIAEPAKVDPFAGIKWNHELCDWSDPGITADSITKTLLGGVSYWRLPEYRPLFEGFTQPGRAELEIEKKILFDARRPNWGGVSKHGKPYFRHMLTLIRLMFPETDITPSLADAVMLFCMGIGGAERKLLNLIGCQNSGKSKSFVVIAFAVMVLDAEYSQVFVANPFDNAADSTVWGDVEEHWGALKESFPNDTGRGYDDASSLFPWGKLYAARQLDLVPGIPKCGSIVLRNVKHVGKFKGSKSRGGKTTLDRGVMLLGVDEVNEIESMAFLGTLTNITSQESFFGITSQNFKDPEDMGGRLTEPRATFGGPGSFEALRIEEDHFWHSHVSSITLRFDGHKSPNILSGKLLYPRLFNQKNVNLLTENYGRESPEYLSQARSFPAKGDLVNSVLSRQQISSSRHEDEHFTMRLISSRVSFCDPAFGGRDKAVWGYAEFGPAVTSDAEGFPTEVELLVFKKGFEVLPLVERATYNEHWFERMRRAGIEIRDFVEGSDVTYEEQIAIQCVERNREHGIPHANFGYDFSMRPDIVNAISRMMGYGAMAFDYNQGPEGIFLNRFNMDSKDCCKNRNTELAFAASDVFIAKQARGGGYIQTALTQLSRTRYETINKKKVSEGKKEYKDRWGQVSPDHRDVLMGIVGVAMRRGFRRNPLTATSKAGDLWEQLSARKDSRGKVFKRI